MTETELRRRLKKLESEPTASTALVSKVGDQYEYDKNFIYIAYASALANLSSGSITNQSDATDFQFTPYTKTGTLMPFRGYFINKSIYQSGDPTDYTWESTSGSAGYTSTERAYTTSTGLQNTLGNPTKPGSGIGWTTLTTGTAIPATATYYAGGGGGGHDGGTKGCGGQGGGGNGASGPYPGSSVAAQNGTANTGGGAGSSNGGGTSVCAKAGGKGVVIIRYKFQ